MTWPAEHAADGAAIERIGCLLESIPDRQLRDLARRWPLGANLVMAVQLADGSRQCLTISRADSTPVIRRGEPWDQATTTFLARSVTWEALLTGKASFAAELRAGRLRRIEPAPGQGDSGTRNDVQLVAHLVSLAARLHRQSRRRQAAWNPPPSPPAGTPPSPAADTKRLTANNENGSGGGG